MLKGYNVRLGYAEVFFFDNIEEAATFFDQAIRHSENTYKWAALEPVHDGNENVDDDGIIDGGDL